MAQQHDLKLAGKLRDARALIFEQLGRTVVGQTETASQILITLFSGGHALLVGVPGLAKTLMVSTLAEILDLKFSRIQFTPDLMPSDITGYDIIEQDHETGKREARYIEGPVFANLLLADEINRTPPKTQAALLQAMQEKEVTFGGVTRKLAPPFFVLATQNPIEQEGTYPLPEAQLDRFLMQINVGYPSRQEEELIASSAAPAAASAHKVLDQREMTELQELVRAVPVPREIIEAAVKMARSSRPDGDAPDYVSKWVTWGAGPRASQALVLAARARCLLEGRFAVSADDLRYVAAPVLRHRIITGFQAEADGIRPDEIISRLVAEAL
ncbi:MAG: MoxR family ATPase [Elusimicrobiaceae bacterium]|nr:MoxR family ATPase [Elusimicrobiaceae bacterium]